MLKIIRSVSFIALFLAFLVTITPVTQAQAAPNYTVSNSAVFKDGQEIKLFGVNWFGTESSSRFSPHGLENRDYKSMISQMKELGFNAVRYPFCPAALTNQDVYGIGFDNNRNQDLQGKRSLEVMDALMTEFNAQGMYVVLDMHTIDCWSLGPLWYNDQYPANKWVSDLQLTAQHFSQYSNFIGIDLMNEPSGATWATGAANDWKIAAETAGQAILSTNPSLLVFVEGVHSNPQCVTGANHWFGGNFEPLRCNPIDTNKIPNHKLVLSPHVYGPDVYWQPYMSAGDFPNNLPGIWETHFGFLTNLDYTLIPGEWGGKFNVEGGSYQDLVLQNKLIEYWKEKKVCNSFYWAWNANATDTGGILQGDWQTPWPAKLQALRSFYETCQSSGSPAPTPTPTPTASPQPSSNSQLQIWAAGTPSNGEYPRLKVSINGSEVKTFSQVYGSPEANQYQVLTYDASTSLTGKTLKLSFDNDFSTGRNNDRNLKIDKVSIGGQVVQIEAPAVYSLGSWSSTTNCDGKFAQSEWLHCNGYFELTLPGIVTTPSPSPSLVPSPSPTPTAVPSPSPSPSPVPTVQTRITVRAAGTPVNNVYPNLELKIKGQTVNTFNNVAGNPATRQFQNLEYTANGVVAAKDISVHFTNDQSSQNEDRNVMIDSLQINAQVYQTETEATYSDGSWSSATGCSPKFARSEWLHCGGYFSYDQNSQTIPSTSTLQVYAAGTVANGQYPSLQVKRDNQILAEFSNIQGQPQDRNFQTFQFSSPTRLNIRDLTFWYSNDGSSANEDRNLMIDKVILDGVSYESEAGSTYSQGSWDSATGCIGKFAQSEWLHCAGYFSY